MSVDKGTIYGFVAPMLAIILVSVYIKHKNFFHREITYTQINAVILVLVLRIVWREKKSKQRFESKNKRKFQDSQRLGRYVNAVKRGQEGSFQTSNFSISVSEVVIFILAFLKLINCHFKSLLKATQN